MNPADAPSTMPAITLVRVGRGIVVEVRIKNRRLFPILPDPSRGQHAAIPLAAAADERIRRIG